ncbi:hypothetical protein LINPERHAP2_LOCUS27053 [Linum perenne]
MESASDNEQEPVISTGNRRIQSPDPSRRRLISSPIGEISAKSAFFSKNCTTFLIVGLAADDRFAQINPSFKTISTSSATNPRNLRSQASKISPLLQHCETQSIRTTSSGFSRASTGRLPHATSSINTPNANTSLLVVAFPVLVSSGARYPIVPTMFVVCGSDPWS